jgi:hypothetical protein
MSVVPNALIAGEGGDPRDGAADLRDAEIVTALYDGLSTS